MTLRGFLDGHRAELGAPLRVFRNRYGIGTVVIAVGIWLAIALVMVLVPDVPIAGRVVVIGVAAGFAAAVLLLTAGEVVAVCERGLALGPSGVLRRPLLVRYDQITPGSLVPVHRARRYAATTGHRHQTAIIRNLGWVDRGIHFVGPSANAARRGGLPILASNHQRSFDGRWIWFMGTGSTLPEQVTALIAEAAGRSGRPDLADAALAAPPRELTGRRGDAPRLLPGYGA